MAEQETSREDKRLPASEQKLRKARLEGQVARSRDVGHAILLTGTMGLIVAIGSSMAKKTGELIRSGLQFDAREAFDTNAILERLGYNLESGLEIALPIAVAGSLGAIAASFIPGGSTLSMKLLRPKSERISPLKGIKRLCSKNHLIDSLKLTLVIFVLSAISGWYIVSRFDQIANLIKQPLKLATTESWMLISFGSACLVAVLILIAMIDVPLQWFRHRNELKMTYQEVKKEHKETEGDPHLRARQRSRQREIGNARMMMAVPSADVIISNPEHFSVALKYDEQSDAAPKVIAKGADHLAFKIRELGRQHDVPNVQSPPLARALYTHVALGDAVPTALYAAVAQVLAYIFQLNQAQIRGEPFKGQLPDTLPVPPELDPANEQAAG